MPMDFTRRSLITGLAALIAAPAIVRAGSLMPVKQMIEPIREVGELYRVMSVVTSSNGLIEVGLGQHGLAAGSFTTSWDNPNLAGCGGINIGDVIQITTGRS